MSTYVSVFAVILTLMLPIIFAHVDAATVTKLAPSKGKPGHLVNIFGTGFAECNSIAMMFGGRPLPSFTQLGDSLIQFKVPNVSSGWYGVSVICDKVKTESVVFNVT